MTIRNYDKSFYETTSYRLSNTSQLKLFNVLEDIETKEKLLNIFNAYFINENIDQAFIYEYYDVSNNEWWDNISYKIYNTPYLWWILPLVNNEINPFESLDEGTTIKVLKPNLVYKILKEIKNIGNK